MYCLPSFALQSQVVEFKENIAGVPDRMFTSPVIEIPGSNVASLTDVSALSLSRVSP